MHVELTFALNLWYETSISDNEVTYGFGSDREIVEIHPQFLTADMLRIINRIVYPYHPVVIRLHDNYVTVTVNYPDDEFLEIGSWLDGIDVSRNAPDNWMEADLEIQEYVDRRSTDESPIPLPDAEFVPTLISCCLGF